MKVTPYLLFNGQCLQALEFYQHVFGGELQYTQVGQSPMAAMFGADAQHKVLNGRLASAVLDISASDWLHPTELPVQGNTLSLFVSQGTAAQSRTIFARLAEQGQITEALSEQPFGLYGACIDRFGVRWMVHAVSGV
ncbi:VOC family protein [Rheinheimera sp.]|uniref:VOC family protein n=1 Tax=Rheinheimera sp. TaxID=1869214 RepID=UPI003AF701F3